MDNSQPFAYWMPQLPSVLPLSRTKICEVIASGELKSFRIGKRRLVSRQAVEQFIARREAAEPTIQEAA